MLRKLLLRIISCSLLIIVVALPAASFVGPAQAFTYGGVSIKPMGPDAQGQPRRSFHFVTAEGTEIRDQVAVTNNSADQVTLFVFGSSHNLENNKLELVPPDETTAGDPTRWITWNTNEVTLAPQGSKAVGFIIKVPNNADVGDHVGAILTSIKTNAAKNRGQSGLNVVTQVGIQLALVVPGDLVRDLKINKITHTINRRNARTLSFIFNATNRGNASLYPAVDAKISGFFGRVGEQLGVKLDGIARNQTSDFNYNWIKRAPYFGRFVANFTFHLGEKEQHNKDGTTTMLPDKTITARYVFWIVPWLELLYLLLGIFVLYLLRSVWLYVLVLNRLRTKTMTYTVVAGDTITKIGAKLGADPRVLAKFNLMRWPYEVKPGDILLIPTGRYAGGEWRDRHWEILSNREFVGGILGHLFRRLKAHHLAERIQGRPAAVVDYRKYAAVIVERGDTIEDIAQFAGTTLETIIKLNRLRPPYRLRAGQELLIPRKRAKSPRRNK